MASTDPLVEGSGKVTGILVEDVGCQHRPDRIGGIAIGQERLELDVPPAPQLVFGDRVVSEPIEALLRCPGSVHEGLLKEFESPMIQDQRVFQAHHLPDQTRHGEFERDESLSVDFVASDIQAADRLLGEVEQVRRIFED